MKIFIPIFLSAAAVATASYWIQPNYKSPSVTSSITYPVSSILQRKIYPYSIVPGGVLNADELIASAKQDYYTAQHYKDIDVPNRMPSTPTATSCRTIRARRSRCSRRTWCSCARRVARRHPARGRARRGARDRAVRRRRQRRRARTYPLHRGGGVAAAFRAGRGGTPAIRRHQGAAAHRRTARAVCAAAAGGAATNLLQGRMHRPPPAPWGCRAWRVAAMLLAGLVALHVAGKAAELQVLKKRERQVDTSIRETFHEAMPGEVSALDARRRMEQRLLRPRAARAADCCRHCRRSRRRATRPRHQRAVAEFSSTARSR